MSLHAWTDHNAGSVSKRETDTIDPGTFFDPVEVQEGREAELSFLREFGRAQPPSIPYRSNSVCLIGRTGIRLTDGGYGKRHLSPELTAPWPGQHRPFLFQRIGVSEIRKPGFPQNRLPVNFQQMETT